MAGKLNANRDVIFMSQRGTYTADPKLTCDPVDRWAAETLNMPYDAPATGHAYAVATLKCRRELAARTAGLGAYNTLESADDLEDLGLRCTLRSGIFSGYLTEPIYAHVHAACPAPHPFGRHLTASLPPSLAGGPRRGRRFPKESTRSSKRSRAVSVSPTLQGHRQQRGSNW